MYNSLGTTRRSRLHLYAITLILIDNTFVLVNLIINDDNAFDVTFMCVVQVRYFTHHSVKYFWNDTLHNFDFLK